MMSYEKFKLFHEWIVDIQRKNGYSESDFNSIPTKLQFTIIEDLCEMSQKNKDTYSEEQWKIAENVAKSSHTLRDVIVNSKYCPHRTAYNLCMLPDTKQSTIMCALSNNEIPFVYPELNDIFAYTGLDKIKETLQQDYNQEEYFPIKNKAVLSDRVVDYLIFHSGFMEDLDFLPLYFCSNKASIRSFVKDYDELSQNNERVVEMILNNPHISEEIKTEVFTNSGAYNPDTIRLNNVPEQIFHSYVMSLCDNVFSNEEIQENVREACGKELERLIEQHKLSNDDYLHIGYELKYVDYGRGKPYQRAFSDICEEFVAVAPPAVAMSVYMDTKSTYNEYIFDALCKNKDVRDNFFDRVADECINILEANGRGKSRAVDNLYSMINKGRIVSNYYDDIINLTNPDEDLLISVICAKNIKTSQLDRILKSNCTPFIRALTTLRKLLIEGMLPTNERAITLEFLSRQDTKTSRIYNICIDDEEYNHFKAVYNKFNSQIKTVRPCKIMHEIFDDITNMHNNVMHARKTDGLKTEDVAQTVDVFVSQEADLINTEAYTSKSISLDCQRLKEMTYGEFKNSFGEMDTNKISQYQIEFVEFLSNQFDSVAEFYMDIDFCYNIYQKFDKLLKEKSHDIMTEKKSASIDEER